MELGIRESGHTGRMADAMHHAEPAFGSHPLAAPRVGGVDFKVKNRPPLSPPYLGQLQCKIRQIRSEQSLRCKKPNCMPERKIRWLALRHYGIAAAGQRSS